MDAVDLKNFFIRPASPRQKQYEVIRAICVDGQTVEAAAKRFGYKASTVYSLLRDAKAGRIELFPTVKKGPRRKQTESEVQSKIIDYRKMRLSSPDIHARLLKDDIFVSVRTIERILRDAGFGKLKRRTDKERGVTRRNKIIPERSEHLDFTELEKFNVDCPVAGVFFFIPYIIESGILDIVRKCDLPASSNIGSLQASLSMLLLKLVGCKRLSHIDTYEKEPGLGLFAGLNVLPKPTYMNTYACLCSQTQLMDFQNEVISLFRHKYPYFYDSDFINLDFHSIPHYGDESEMEKVWCGSRGKTMKGATTVFAQDSRSNMVIYSRADILRSEEADEIKRFAAYWRRIKGDVNETLVFDCKFTTYKVLNELNGDKIKFLTLRKRSASLLEQTSAIPSKKWKRVYVAIPKRKHKRVSVYESYIKLKGYKYELRQVVVKDHGRHKPTFIITNNSELDIKTILEVYAKRWRIENKFAEMVAFFNLNALSSPVMIRIHFDILFTMIADTLYHVLAQDLRRFEKNLAPTIFRKFIDMPGRVVFDGHKFYIKIRKRAHTPILKEVDKLITPFSVPWLDNKTVEVVWTA
jgi:transposase